MSQPPRELSKLLWGCSRLVSILLLQFSDNTDCIRIAASSGGGQGGGSPGEQAAGGVRETGEERAEGGISTMAGSGREIQKGKLLLFVTAYFQSKKRTQERFLTSI